jgi:hypothetical protein
MPVLPSEPAIDPQPPHLQVIDLEKASARSGPDNASSARCLPQQTLSRGHDARNPYDSGQHCNPLPGTDTVSAFATDIKSAFNSRQNVSGNAGTCQWSRRNDASGYAGTMSASLPESGAVT